MPTTPLARAPARHAIALMYHALADGGLPAGQDPRYTLAATSFEDQLRLIRRRAGGSGSTRDWLMGKHDHAVLLTFDDGHVSNHRLAVPLLVEYGMSADFFVNPALVGHAGFADWVELREMSAHGMSIQCHGHDHVYLTSLKPAVLREQLKAARLEIEDRIGNPVTLLAPPGGRMPYGLARTARDCGYSHVLSSRPGRIRTKATGTIFPRMAVTQGITSQELEGWMDAKENSLLREKLRYSGLAVVKQVLGDLRYERLRARALGGTRDPA